MTERKPTGRPRALSSEQEARVYAEIPGLRHGKRHQAMSQLAQEFGTSVSTIERSLARQRRAHLQRIAQTFHDLQQNSTSEVTR